MTRMTAAETNEMQGRKKLTVLAWPLRSPANRYPEALYMHLPNVDAHDFVAGWSGLKAIFRRKYDVFHIHWLERAFWRGGRFAVLKAVAATLCAAALLKLRGASIIWTAHDPVPHDMKGNAIFRRGAFYWLWRVYSHLLVAMTDGVILLSATHRDILAATYPGLMRKASAVIPHPHFKGVYPADAGRGLARSRLGIEEDSFLLLLPGSIRPYKNAEALIAAFARLAASDLRLLIAGKADTPAYAEKLRALGGKDERIRFSFDFIPDDALQLYLSAADLVVIPFRKATNSGSVALALSFARPVAVPDIPVFREVRDIVGSDWLYLFPGELDAAGLERIIAWARTTPRAAEPDLGELDWERIAERTMDFFHAVRGG